MFVCIQHKGAPRRLTLIHKVHLKKKKLEKDTRQIILKKEGQVTKATKIPPLLCNKLFFFFVAGMMIRKSTFVMILSSSGIADLDENHKTQC